MTSTQTAPPKTGTGRETQEGRLIVQGEDRPGVVAAVSSVLAQAGANIVSLDQHSTDPVGGRFYQRTVFRLAGLGAARPQLEKALDREIRDKLGLEWRLSEAGRRKRVAIFASKTDHCLLDLLWRQQRGELNVKVEMVVSNHPDLADQVRRFDIPYFYVPVIDGDKKTAEQEHLRLLQGNVDFVVLARYMQIISGDFIRDVAVPIINIHHSFLPAFIGAGPYQKAKDRGVKLIGATAHYVTEDLDEGPIIEQDVVRVSHADTTRDLVRRGADVERLVLARAVAWHAEDRVLREGNSTIVFAS
ncbi:formyltetrahydrofolate deformylase [Streptomyces griseorubiginosus]|uniref:formyltetrahydrofolate deformylase n=1 Tax=Streptomyces griseorubiginosus TaxID=67304 RepID=UPI001AD6CB6E|nr:formyltetrahydrofolate deformylase [Streptomyces griseorubiginosus]MBO4253144.1 formyltetrahydrofolate deformylase [Streptomyces griseorubiginosus]